MHASGAIHLYTGRGRKPGIACVFCRPEAVTVVHPDDHTADGGRKGQSKRQQRRGGAAEHALISQRHEAVHGPHNTAQQCNRMKGMRASLQLTNGKVQLTSCKVGSDFGSCGHWHAAQMACLT